MGKLSLYNVREIISFDEKTLDSYLQVNEFTNDSTKYLILLNMYNINKPGVNILYNHNWFNDSFLEYILNKKNHFLILYMNQEYDFYKLSEVFESFVNIIENHEPSKFYKYLDIYNKKKNNKELLSFIDENNRTLLSFAVFTCDKSMVEYLINSGLDKNIVDKDGYNLYDRLTILNHLLLNEECIQDFINWMVDRDIKLNTSKLKKCDEFMKNENYAYYQSLLREQNLKKCVYTYVSKKEDSSRTKTKI